MSKIISLITTKKNNYPDITNEKKIYLGNWCLQNKYVADNDETVADYHWDDRNKLENDFSYVLNLSEKLAKYIGDELNKIHKIKKKDEYWKLTLQYWLITYISSSFDLWENLNLTLKNYNINNVLISIGENIEFQDLIVENSREFSMLCTNDLWVSYLSKKIIEYLKKNNETTIDIRLKNETTEVNKYTAYLGPIKYKRDFVKNILISLYIKISRFINTNNQLVTYRTRMGILNEIKLNLKFSQTPFIFRGNFYKKKKIDIQLRKNTKINYSTKNNYEKFLVSNIFLFIPKEFVEDFHSIEEYIKSYFPKNPKIILSSNSLIRENIFTRYIADMKEHKSKCFYMQHGGVYGHLKLHWNEIFEKQISDKYLTWGWSNDEKEIAFGMVKKLPLKQNEINRIRTNKYIYFLRSRPRYNIKINSSVGSNQLCKYYQECLSFFKNKNLLNINKEIVARFHEAKFDWDHEFIWKKNLQDINFSYTNTESLRNVYLNYELIIYSYIGTGFLESLALDKPFILISSLKEWKLRESAIEDFEKLKSAKIFFETNEEAIEHLNNINANIYSWWDKKEIQLIKEEFKKKYARYIDEKTAIGKLYNLIKKNI